MKEWQIMPINKGQSYAGYIYVYEPEFEMYPDNYTAFFEEYNFKLKDHTLLNEFKLIKFQTGKFCLSYSANNEQELKSLVANLLNLDIPCKLDKMRAKIAWHTRENGWPAALDCPIYAKGEVATKEQLGAILIEISKIYPFSSQLAKSLNNILKPKDNLKFTLAVTSLQEQCFRHIINNNSFFSENKISSLPLELREQITLAMQK